MSNNIINSLIEGNKRFAEGINKYDRTSIQHRIDCIDGQEPKAIIIGCSDSRVPPEIIFDQGLGDLFTIRVAGNVISDEVIASIEYAVQNLNTSVIIVLSHTNCGAVNAAVTYDGEKTEGRIIKIINEIKPAVQNAMTLEGDLLDNSIKENAKIVGQRIATSGKIIQDAVDESDLSIYPAYYDFMTGIVEFL